MVALARTIYSDTPDHDPVSLLDTDRFAGPEELEDHLLDNFIPTVYRHRLHGGPSSSGSRPHPGFEADRARHWLGYLAHHLTRLKTPTSPGGGSATDWAAPPAPSSPPS